VLPSLRLPGRLSRDELRLPLDLRPALQADLAVIGGYSFLAFQAAMALRRLWRRPYLLWCETPRLDSGGLASQTARALLLRQARAARGVLAIGARAQQVWQGVLGPGAAVVNFPYVCALGRYLSLQRAPRPEGAPFTLLFCGQLVHRKGVDVLAEAFGRAAREEPRLRLLLAGEGPERAALARALPPGRFELRGHVPWESLPALYAEADALVLPSRHDGWGLVVNEALASGIPVIATSAVGAAADLLREGETGFLMPPEDVTALTGALLLAARAPPGMGERARQLARERLLPELAARRFAKFVTNALSDRPLEEGAR
jgi:glycosyltransferase involved in cell wall biosynthesis